MLFVGAEIQLLDGKGSIKKACLQSTFKSNDSVTIADIGWYRVQMVTAECLKARDATDLGRVVASRS